MTPEFRTKVLLRVGGPDLSDKSLAWWDDLRDYRCALEDAVLAKGCNIEYRPDWPVVGRVGAMISQPFDNDVEHVGEGTNPTDALTLAAVRAMNMEVPG